MSIVAKRNREDSLLNDRHMKYKDKHEVISPSETPNENRRMLNDKNKKRKWYSTNRIPSPESDDGKPCSPTNFETELIKEKINSKSPIFKAIDNYLGFVRGMYYGSANFAAPDPIPGISQKSIDIRRTSLGMLTSPVRKRNIIDEWAPREIALFESAICVYGKHFHKIAKMIPSKTTKQVVEFYYIWKKTSHYKLWKDSFEDFSDM